MLATLSQMQNAIKDFSDATQAVKAIASASGDIPSLMSDVRNRVEEGSSVVTTELAGAADQARAMSGALSSINTQLGSIRQSSVEGAATLNAAIGAQMADVRQSLVQAVARAGAEANESARQGAAQLTADLDRARTAFADAVIKFGQELQTMQEMMSKR